jgi:hypothetical protein
LIVIEEPAVVEGEDGQVAPGPAPDVARHEPEEQDGAGQPHDRPDATPSALAQHRPEVAIGIEEAGRGDVHRSGDGQHGQAAGERTAGDQEVERDAEQRHERGEHERDEEPARPEPGGSPRLCQRGSIPGARAGPLGPAAPGVPGRRQTGRQRVVLGALRQGRRSESRGALFDRRGHGLEGRSLLYVMRSVFYQCGSSGRAADPC